MARPIKTGLDYFPLDVRNDDKLDLIEAEFGIIGFGIVIKLYRKIYENSYFYEWGEDQLLLFKKKVNVDINLINDVINACFRRDLFNKKIFDNYKILTSTGIQKRFIQAVKNSRRSQVILEEKYLCKGINDYINSINSELIIVNSDINTQSKVKESKVKEIIENKLIFYSNQIKAIEENESLKDRYIALVSYLFGENALNCPVEYILKLEKQLTFNEYKKLFSASHAKNLTVGELMDSWVNNPKYSKGKISIYLTLNNWINRSDGKSLKPSSEKKWTEIPKTGETLSLLEIIKKMNK